MKKLMSTLRSIRLNQIILVFLAGVLVLFSTACGRPNTVADRLTGNGGSITPGQSQSYKGGMNNFNDVDSNRLNAEAAAKAKALRDKVDSRINKKGINSADDLVDNVRAADPGKQAQRLGDDVRKQADDVKENLQNFGDRGAKNVKRNAENATDNAKANVDSGLSNTKRSFDKTANAAKSKVNSDVNAAKRALDNAA